MIFKGPYPDVSVPNIHFTEFVFSHSKHLGSKPALIDSHTGRVLSYSDLLEQIYSFAAKLRADSFCKSDILAILTPNLPEYAVVFHAAAMLGGATTTLNPMGMASDIAHQICDSTARFAVTTEELSDKLPAAVTHRYVVDSACSWFSQETVEPQKISECVEVNPNEDLIALPYSSGTTGLPKGVMLTHGNLVANLCQMQATEGICEEDTLLCVLPLFHIYGLVVILNMGLFAGATIVLQRRFELASTLQAIQDYGVTFAHLVPPVMLAIASDPVVSEYDLSRLRVVMSAAAPLSGDLAELCSKRLGCVVKQGYGMTETSPAATMERPIAEFTKPGSVGQPVPNTELMIVDLENSTPLGPRQTGEVLIRGPQVMHGYLNKPEATASTITKDGWLRTGDIGYVDEDGYLFIVDRAKELIKYKGFQVAPAELEGLLLAHPAVADVAVVPIPDVEAGELPKAFVVSRFPVAESELIDYVAERVTPYKRVRAVEFIDQIPKSPSGKILRRVLVARERKRLGLN